MKRRTAKSHPQNLHETIDVCIGWETLGQVGRFKAAKTWYAALLIQHEGKAYPAWHAEAFTSRSQAEQFIINQWRADIDSLARAAARNECAARVLEAEQRASAAESEARNDALANCGYEELTEALKTHLEQTYSRYAPAREYVAGELMDFLEDHVTDHISEAGLRKMVKEAGLTLLDEVGGAVVHARVPELAAKIGDDWALFKDIERIRYELDALAEIVRYECNGSIELF